MGLNIITEDELYITQFQTANIRCAALSECCFTSVFVPFVAVLVVSE